MNQQHTLLFATLGPDVRQALKEWHGNSDAPSPLRYLYLFRQVQREGYNNERQATNQVLLRAIEALEATHPQDAHLLQLRFLDLLPIYQLANQFNVAESTFYTMQREAVERLTTTIRRLELEARATQQALLIMRLEPATYTNLVGVDGQVEQLQKLVTSPAAPWIVAIEGIGGIGKTSLADRLLRALIEQGPFDEMGWVSARRKRFTLDGALQAVEQPSLTARHCSKSCSNNCCRSWRLPIARPSPSC
jgi:hypothetical protein